MTLIQLLRNIKSKFFWGYSLEDILEIEQIFKDELNDYLNSIESKEKSKLIILTKTIRGIETPYILSVIEFDKDSQGLTFRKIELRTLILQNGHLTILNGISGSLYFSEKLNKDGDKYVKIDDVRVSEEARRNGFSKDMLSLCFKISKENKIEYIIGGIVPHDLAENSFLLDYYQKLGASIISRGEHSIIIKKTIYHNITA